MTEVYLIAVLTVLVPNLSCSSNKDESTSYRMAAIHHCNIKPYVIVVHIFYVE